MKIDPFFRLFGKHGLNFFPKAKILYRRFSDYISADANSTMEGKRAEGAFEGSEPLARKIL